MKTRTSLVSNSSTSSFVAVLTLTDFNNILSNGNFPDSFLKRLERVTNCSCLDEKNMILITVISGDSSNWNQYESSNSEEEYESNEDNMNRLQTEIEKLKDQGKAITVSDSI